MEKESQSQSCERKQDTKLINVNPALLKCAGCDESILTRYLLGALKTYWHENCLQCDVCRKPFINDGNILYYRSGKKLCASDYAKAFGITGTCAMCEEEIQATEYVLKFKNNLCYHVECFNCCLCRGSFCVGDEFVMLGKKEIYCIDDYKRKFADRKNP